MTKREMMVEAHRMAREELEGDYQARLSLALRQLWREEKEEGEMRDKKEIVKDVENVLEDVKLGDKTYHCNRWKKSGHDRLYINRTNGRNNKSVGYIDLEDPDLENVERQTHMVNMKFEEVLISALEQVGEL